MTKRLVEAAKTYIEEIRRQGAIEVEIMPEPVAGADLWIRIKAPSWDKVDELLRKTIELDEEWSSRYGVDVLATVSWTGPVG